MWVYIYGINDTYQPVYLLLLQVQVYFYSPLFNRNGSTTPLLTDFHSELLVLIVLYSFIYVFIFTHEIIKFKEGDSTID